VQAQIMQLKFCKPKLQTQIAHWW